MFEYRSPIKQDSDKWSPIVTSDSLFDIDPQSVAQYAVQRAKRLTAIFGPMNETIA